MEKTVLIVGNSVEKQDTMAVKIVNKIKKKFPKISFMSWDPTEELPPSVSGDILLIDSVVGINEVRIFYALSDFITSPRNSVHDFDLPVSLGLLQKLGITDQISIIGVPATGNKRILSKALAEALATTLKRMK